MAKGEGDINQENRLGNTMDSSQLLSIATVDAVKCIPEENGHSNRDEGYA